MVEVQAVRLSNILLNISTSEETSDKITVMKIYRFQKKFVLVIFGASGDLAKHKKGVHLQFKGYNYEYLVAKGKIFEQENEKC